MKAMKSVLWAVGAALGVFGATAGQAYEMVESEPSPATFLETRGVGDGETFLLGAGTTLPLRYDTAWAGSGATGVNVNETGPGGAVSTLLSRDGEAAGDLAWAPAAPGLYTLGHRAGGAGELTARVQVLDGGTTVHQEDALAGNVTWGAGKVHVVQGTVTVGAGATLTIASGAVVKFTEGSALVVASGGKCVANGVIFTPIADDTVGGDTMGDGDATRPAGDTYVLTGNVTGDEWTEKRWLTLEGLQWNYSRVDGKAVLSSPAIPTTTIGAVMVPAKLGGYPVTGIGDSAFAGCGKLTMVAIQDGMKSIGEHAFDGCGRLASVVIPDGVTRIGDEAFEGCERLDSVVLPSTLNDWGLRSLPPAMQASLEYGADGFMMTNGWVLGYRDSGAAALELPAGTVGIGSHALADFWDLETVEMPESLKYIGRGAFETNTYLDNVVIPDGVKAIWGGAFQGCTFIRDLSIGAGVEEIGPEAFARCSQLATVTVPESVTAIGDAAFSNCWRMLSVKLPLGLESAGTGMFAACKALTGVTMPTHQFTAAQLFEERYAQLESVTVAEGETVVCPYAFDGCAALATVSLPASLKEIGGVAFWNCSALTDIELPEGLEAIGAEAFRECGRLEAIVLPNSVARLGTGVFRDCTSLQNATLSRSLDTLPDYVFDGCQSLSSLVVPASVTTIGEGLGNYIEAFYYLGNAPAYDAGAYSPRAADLTTYVVRGSRGWDGIPSSRDLPETWIGYPITFWAPNRFDAHFDANGGAFTNGTTMVSCEEITDTGYVLPAELPSRAGYDFDGWWTDPAEGARIKTTMRVKETREITFYAHWKKLPSPDTLPVVTEDSEVAAVFAGAADTNLVEYIRTAAVYGDFREWTLTLKDGDGQTVTAAAVLASPHAWISYALGAAGLFENEPVIRFTAIASGAPDAAPNGRRAVAGTVTVRVAVQDGSTIVPVDADKLRELFAATSDLRDWTGAALAISGVEVVDTAEDGTMTFSVGIAGGTPGQAFVGLRQ